MIDLVVLVGYLGFSTVLGGLLAGKQATIRDFFLGGRKLPWYAVAGSIVATEISAVTFISLPAIVYAANGDLTYLQLTLGSVLARVIVGVWFVPAFYEREIYSPYEYVGQRLGRPALHVTTGLFVLGAVLGQSVRVLMAALVLEMVSGIPLGYSIWIIGAVATAWTLLGGITTVIWTDLIQFFVFLTGLIAALVFLIGDLPGGWREAWNAAADAGKLRFLNLSTDPRATFTLWTALLANTVLCLNAYGTDQLIAQRMFCCRGPREARKAIIASSIGVGVAFLAAAVGLGLYAFYLRNPLSASAARSVAERVDNIFPIFIIEQMPPGMTGLIIAGIFAAAISSLDSVLAALSQTTVTTVYRPWRAQKERRRALSPGGTASSLIESSSMDDREVLVSKGFVVLWAVALCGMAQVAELARQERRDILNLALEMASYTGGAMLAAFFLAFWRLKVDHRGLFWGAPASVLFVFSLAWHERWAQIITVLCAAIIFLTWIPGARAYSAAENAVSKPNGRHGAAPATIRVIQSMTLLAVCTIAVVLSTVPFEGGFARVTWPWNVPIGFVVAFGLGWLLGRKPGV